MPTIPRRSILSATTAGRGAIRGSGKVAEARTTSRSVSIDGSRLEASNAASPAPFRLREPNEPAASKSLFIDAFRSPGENTAHLSKYHVVPMPLRLDVYGGGEVVAALSRRKLVAAEKNTSDAA
jgi:hypothetical protein